LKISENYYQKLNSLITSYRILQDLRKRTGQRIWAYENRDEFREKRNLPPISLVSDDKIFLDVIFGDFSKHTEGLREKEKIIVKNLELLAKEHPLWINWLSKIDGVGPKSAGIIIGLLFTKDFASRSSMKIYCGLGTTDKGEPQHPIKGKKLNYVPYLKIFFVGDENLADCLIKKRSEPYYSYYLKVKSEATKKHPEYIRPENGWKSLPTNQQYPQRLDRIARKKMMILFLSHLWEVMFQIKNPDRPVPLPMHFKNTPIDIKDYIPPPHFM